MFSLNDFLWSDSSILGASSSCTPRCSWVTVCLDKCHIVTCSPDKCGGYCYSFGICANKCSIILCGGKKKGFDPIVPIAPDPIDIGF